MKPEEKTKILITVRLSPELHHRTKVILTKRGLTYQRFLEQKLKELVELNEIGVPHVGLSEK